MKTYKSTDASPGSPSPAWEDELAKYRSLFANMTEGFALGDVLRDTQDEVSDFRLLEVNEAFFTQTGFPRDILGRPSREWAPQQESSWREHFCGVAMSGSARHFESYNADSGRHYDVYCYRPHPGYFAILFRDISDRIRLERELRERERLYREREHELSQMVTGLPGLVWTARSDGQSDFFSNQWQAYSGVPPARLVGEGWLDILHPEDRAHAVAVWKEANRVQRDFDVEYRIRRHDGRYHWFSGRGVPLRDKAGRIMRWFGICTDIDALKRAQEALVESEQRYHALFGNRLNGIVHGRILTDAEGRPVDFIYLRVNEGYERIVGRPAAEVEGRRLTELYPGVERMKPDLVGLFGQVALTQGEAREEFFFPHGQRWYEVYAYSHKRGEFTVLFSDVSERKQAELRLRRNEGELNAAFDQAAVGIAHISPDGHWLRINRKFADLLGYNEAELVGAHFRDRTHPDDFAHDLAQRERLHRGEVNWVTVEKRYLHRQGHAVWMRVTMSAVRDENGEHLYNLVVAEDITDRKQAEQALSASEAELRAAFEQATVGIARLDPGLRVSQANLAFTQIMGYSEDELQQKTIPELTYPADRPISVDKLRQVFAGESEGFTVEKRYVRKNGHPVWVRTTVSPIRDAATGAIQSAVKFIEDISEHKRTQAELEGFFRQAAVGMVVLDPESRMLRLNQKFCELVGYDCGELQGTRYMDLNHPEDSGADKELFERLLSGAIPEYVMEKRLRRRDGGYVWTLVSAALVREEPEARSYAVVVIQDIQARKELEAELRQYQQELEERVARRTAQLETANVALQRQEERFRTVLETAADAYIAVEQSGVVVEWNQAATAMFGWAREEVLGRQLADTIIPERYRGQHERSFRRFTETGVSDVMTHSRELPAKHRDGHEFPVEVTLNANHIGGRWLINSFIRDITTRKASEAALRDAKEQAEAASRAKTEFLATMSHEIRTPLNGVIGFTGLLLDGPLTEEKRHYAELARQSGESLLHLLNDFLDFSKIEAGRLELEPVEFDLHLEVSQVLALVQPGAQAKGLELKRNIAVPHRLRGDAARLRQILLNLLSNAVKFTEAGHVLLCCSEARREGTRVRICFEVIDTGIGIDPAIRPYLFKPFVQAESITRRFGGTGLGLAISKRLAEAMGGEIGFRSARGEGSAFWVELPFELLPAEEKPLPDASLDEFRSQPEGEFRGRVLVAEDNSVSQMLAAEVLKRLGCQVDVVGNGIEAVEAYRQLPYDLIFMDCDMPVMDGFEATRQIRQLEAGDLPTGEIHVGDLPAAAPSAGDTQPGESHVGQPRVANAHVANAHVGNPHVANAHVANAHVGNPHVANAHVPIIAMTASALQGDPEKCIAAGMDEFMSKPLRLQQLSKVVDAWLKPPSGK